jgi:hypothetical protein
MGQSRIGTLIPVDTLDRLEDMFIKSILMIERVLQTKGRAARQQFDNADQSGVDSAGGCSTAYSAGKGMWLRPVRTGSLQPSTMITTFQQRGNNHTQLPISTACKAL